VVIDYNINMQQYITYTRVKASNSVYLDPNTNWKFEEATNESKFNETPYEFNWVFLASVEYPDNTPQEVVDWLLEAYKPFDFQFITEEEANIFLAQIWDIKVKDFIFEDNREPLII